MLTFWLAQSGKPPDATGLPLAQPEAINELRERYSCLSRREPSSYRRRPSPSRFASRVTFLSERDAAFRRQYSHSIHFTIRHL